MQLERLIAPLIYIGLTIIFIHLVLWENYFSLLVLYIRWPTTIIVIILLADNYDHIIAIYCPQPFDTFEISCSSLRWRRLFLLNAGTVFIALCYGQWSLGPTKWWQFVADPVQRKWSNGYRKQILSKTLQDVNCRQWSTSNWTAVHFLVSRIVVSSHFSELHISVRGWWILILSPMLEKSLYYRLFNHYVWNIRPVWKAVPLLVAPELGYLSNVATIAKSWPCKRRRDKIRRSEMQGYTARDKKGAMKWDLKTDIWKVGAGLQRPRWDRIRWEKLVWEGIISKESTKGVGYRKRGYQGADLNHSDPRAPTKMPAMENVVTKVAMLTATTKWMQKNSSDIKGKRGLVIHRHGNKGQGNAKEEMQWSKQIESQIGGGIVQHCPWWKTYRLWESRLERNQ